jgi:hypothetical protein
MERIIKVGDIEIPVKSTAASALQYKSHFGSDGVRALFALIQSVAVDEKGAVSFDSVDFDFEVAYRFLWIYARAADPEIKPLEEWLEGFSVPTLTFVIDALPELINLMIETTAPTVKPKNSEAAKAPQTRAKK